MEYSGGYFLVLIDSEEVCSMLLLLPGFEEKQCILSFYAGFKMCAAFRQLASSLLKSQNISDSMQVKYV